MRRHQSLIDQLRLEEKASLLSGANFWNTKAVERVDIPSIMLTDGPHGLRKQGGKVDHLGLNASIAATCFPTAATIANSWDVKLVESVGAAIGQEAKAEKVSVVLGPGLNIIRNPLGGRSFEYYSEDPYVSGHLAAAAVNGIQSTGVAASPKHFAVNSQEHLRMTIDEIVDERSLREIYLEGFRHVVETAHPKTIMTSYNKVNGVYANENPHLLETILKKIWKYNGIVVTDWGGENDRVAGLLAGNQLEMPSSNGITDREIIKAVQKGELHLAVVDDAVDDMLELIFSTTRALESPESVSFDRHHQLAVRAATQSIVLLKNEAAVLPLKPKTKVGIIGDFADTPRYQGAGSSLVNPTRVDSALEMLHNTDLDIVGYEPGFKRSGGHSAKLQKHALHLAEQADTVLLFLGLDESMEAEGLDRQHMRLAETQLQMVKALSETDTKLIVVLAGGAPVEMPFAHAADAIVHGFLGGQGSGQAIADVLTGSANPSGKLAVTYPLKYEDVPSAPYFPGKEVSSEHREGIFVGYRYYDTREVPVLFPFGHGLSYTQFEYSDIKVGEEEVSWTVRNIGHVPGAESSQVYIQPRHSKVVRAKRELKGFGKVFLEPDEARRVTVQLDSHAFRYYNTAADRWVMEPGQYEIQVAASLNDVRLKGTVSLIGEEVAEADPMSAIELYQTADVQKIDHDTFEKLVGRTLPVQTWDRQQPLTPADTIDQLQYANAFGRFTRGLILFAQKVLFALGRPIAANNIMFILAMPFNKLERFTGGKVSRKAIDRFLRWSNR